MKAFPIYRTGIGQYSHRFLSPDSSKPCVIGGLIFEDVPGLDAESDGDVVHLALCNAISSLSGVPILSTIAIDLCRKDGITDSQVYVARALETLGGAGDGAGQQIVHVAIAIEGKRPHVERWIEPMRAKVAETLGLSVAEVGITAISGEGLTDFGCGDGLHATCVVTTVQMGVRGSPFGLM